MSITAIRNVSRAASGSPRRPGSPAFSALLARLGEEFARRAAHYDRTGDLSQENFRRLHQEGLQAGERAFEAVESEVVQ
ncbi:hypothetical protein [Azotobacter armeniacus]